MHKLNVTKDIFEEKNIFGSEIKKAFQLIEKNANSHLPKLKVFSIFLISSIN